MTLTRTLTLLLSLLLLAAPLHAEEDEEKEAPKKAIYHPLQPAFVVNVEDGPRTHFMQITVQLMTRDPKVVEKVEANQPPLRHAMIMLLGHQAGDTMRSVQGREEVRQQALTEVQRVMKEVAGVKEDKIEAVYFTDFVIQ